MIHEGCECRKKVQHLYFRLQKFAKHVQGFGGVVNCSWDAGNVHKKFQTYWNSRRTKNDSRTQLTNHRTCLANFWSLKYLCQTLQFFRYSHASQIVRVPMKTLLVKSSPEVSYWSYLTERLTLSWGCVRCGAWIVYVWHGHCPTSRLAGPPPQGTWAGCGRVGLEKLGLVQAGWGRAGEEAPLTNCWKQEKKWKKIALTIHTIWISGQALLTPEEHETLRCFSYWSLIPKIQE